MVCVANFERRGHGRIRGKCHICRHELSQL
jgi:hypothetical protein